MKYLSHIIYGLYLYQVLKARKNLSLKQLQLLIWLLLAAAMFASLLAMDGAVQAFTYTILNIVAYAMVIYGNISLLHPYFWGRKRYVWYIILAAILVVAVAAGRALSSYYIYAAFFTEKTSPFKSAIIVTYLFSNSLIFLISFVVKYAIDYFHLLQFTESIRFKQNKAELDLLKAQVNPHFLFNTLNNIYYEAYLESPKTALLIEKLADMMRYMVDESKAERVLLAKEVAFIENYIALEQIRMVHTVNIEFTRNFEADLELPPMLLVAFTENIFKHGLDKSSSRNVILLQLEQEDGFLSFKASNSTVLIPAKKEGGSGLENLKQRLTLLYGTTFEMHTGLDGNNFIAYFKIPLN